MMIFLCGCSSSPQNLPGNIPLAVMPKEETWDILDYKNSKSEPMPGWVERYLRGGSRLVEEMPEFEGRRVFVSEDEGVSFSALERRRLNFDLLLDFPQLAVLRINRRLTALGGSNPDREFSRYHEAAVRTAAGAIWPEARREGDFWLIKGFAGEAGETEERAAYALLILITVDRELFNADLDEILWGSTEGPAENPETSREQAAVLRRMRNTFYDGF
jgi:hypothetical protein